MKIEHFLKKNESIYILSLKLFSIYKLFKVNMFKRFSDQMRRKYIKVRYKKFTGLDLDWNNLARYTEKMQWYKLYSSTEEMKICADKYTVRKWVADKIGEEYLIPLLGVWDKPDEIPFERLPRQYVLKTSCGSGTNIIVKDNCLLNRKVIMKRISCWLNADYAYLNGFEMQYAACENKVIAEQYMDSPDGDLPDYKFLCFGGKPYYCWVDIGRYHEHKRNIYDLEWNLQKWNQSDYGNSQKPIKKPKNFEKMVEIVGILCKDFSHVRVDLYNIDGKILFGEMTFTNGSGFELIIPDEYNKKIGDLWNLKM